VAECFGDDGVHVSEVRGTGGHDASGFPERRKTIMTPANRRRAAILAALSAFGLGSFVSTQSASAQRVRPDSDYDNDGVNNRYDRDDDNDGIRDARDRDDDNDGIRDARDRDDDNDGIPDASDRNRPRPGVYGRTWVEPQLHGEWRFRYRPFRYDDRHYDDIDAYELGDYDLNHDRILSHVEEDYMRFDRNGDGRLSLGERQAFWIHMARMGMFGPVTPAQARELGSIASTLDANGDGRLTRYEVRRLVRFIKARQLFLAFDRDRDGRLFRGETRGWFAREFFDLDLNGDRTITMRELRRALLPAPRAYYWSWQ
jgi:hypothetical protein